MIYKWLWYFTEFWLTPEQRRPYTYILRDFYHQHPILTLFICAWAVYLFNHYLTVSWQEWLLLSIGVLLGHLFWAPYKEGQQEYPAYLGGRDDKG